MNPLPVVPVLLALLGLLSPALPPALAPAHGPADDPAHHSVTTSPAPIGVWPLEPRPPVVRGFDPPSGPYGPGHRGVDLGGTIGQLVHTALPGTVTYAGLLAGVAVVVVDHGATRTTYQPVSASVSVGTPVAPGATIGTLGLAGSHCLPAACLHWGWIRNPGPEGPQVYLDPLRLVGLTPMRLLPLGRLEAG